MLSPFVSRSYRPDAVDLELLRLALPLGMPARVWALPKVPGMPEQGMSLTPTQYDRFVVLSATPPGQPSLKAALKDLMDSPAYTQLSDGPQGGKALLIRGRVQQYREQAKALLRSEDEAVARHFSTVELSRKLATTPQGVEAFQRQQRSGAGIGIGR